MSRFARRSLYFAIFALVVAMFPGMLMTWGMLVEAMGPLTPGNLAGFLIPVVYLLVMLGAVGLLAIALWRDCKRP
jgi:hypothetical protein